MPPSPKYTKLDWDNVEMLVNAVHLAMKNEEYYPSRILALGRGAMPVARLIAREQPIYYWGLASYEKEERGKIHEYQSPPSVDLIDSPTTLIVDDLWDSGQTFEFARKRFPKAKTAALLSKSSEHSLDFVGEDLTDGSWIIFPWECN